MLERLTRSLRDRHADELHLTSLESEPVRRRRQVVSAITLVLGAVTLGWALRIPPGDPLFYPATLGLAAIWGGGSLLAGRPLRATNEHEKARASGLALRGFVIGLVLLVVFLVGAVGVSQVPVLREPVQELLAHAQWGSFWIVAAITALNGVVEERFFRGALYDALGGRWAVLTTTVLYTIVTALAGIPLLALAALLLGFTVGVLRRLSRGILAPIVAHITWSLGMLILLGPTLSLLERA